MLKLLKYEIIRKWKSLSVAFIIFSIVEIICLILLKSNEGYKLAVSFPIYIFLGFAAIIFLLLSGISTYKKDLYDKTGYMIFLTPNSGYKIVGSKLIVSAGEYILGLGLYILFGILNLNLISTRVPDLSNWIVEMESILKLDYNQLVSAFLCTFLVIVILWFNFMLTIYLSMSLHKSVFSNVKHAGIINFIIFLAVNFIVSNIYSFVGNHIDNVSATEFSYDNLHFFLSPSFYVIILVGIVMYFITGYLIDKRVSLY